MASALVATKLHAPSPRQGPVGRSGLIGRLLRGTQAKLTLISAPAGFGKTTLLAEYLAARENRAVAWLSLDRADNEPVAFWSNVLAALQTAVPGIGAALLPLLQSGQGPTEPILAALLNELGSSSADIEIVLDDYHVIDRPEIEAGTAFLLEHLPPNVHISIGTRADPALPVSRLRARGELVEIRAADLRFTAKEAAVYLNDAMGLNLGTRDVATLTQRTEGWIAALQLAALSIERRDDVSGFIAGFAGDDRYVVDYLVDEVLLRQPENVRRFLRRTCFLERLSGPLCDAVIAEGGSGAMLESLERANLFVVPLDSRREWYRYHHLFADVLQTHFAGELRLELPVLHRRASEWYAAHGARNEAIQHALSGADVERAAGLIEGAIPGLRKSREEMTLGAWIEALPDDLVRSRPVLGLAFVGGLISMGRFEGIEDRLTEAEALLAAAATGGAAAVTADPDQLPGLPAAIELYRAALAQVRGEVPRVIEHAERCLALAPTDDHLVRAGASGFLGIAYWTAGDLEAAQRGWSDCRDGLKRAGHIADVFGTSIALADINQTLGRLRAAARVFDDALELSAAQRSYIPRGTADAHAGLSEVHRMSGDLDLASQHLVRSEELGELAGLPQFPYRWRVAMAQLRLAEGDPEAALDLLDEAERVYVPDFFPNVRPISAMKARVLIRQGRLAEARRWQGEAGIDAADALSYSREFEHLTLARLLLAEQQVDGGAAGTALGLLDRLLQAADIGARLGSVIEISVLRALALKRDGDTAAAVEALVRALGLAEPEGYVRVFVDEGEPMAALLKTAVRRNGAAAFARTLLAAFDLAGERRGVPPAPADDLLEPLS